MQIFLLALLASLVVLQADAKAKASTHVPTIKPTAAVTSSPTKSVSPTVTVTKSPTTLSTGAPNTAVPTSQPAGSVTSQPSPNSIFTFAPTPEVTTNSTCSDYESKATTCANQMSNMFIQGLPSGGQFSNFADACTYTQSFLLSEAQCAINGVDGCAVECAANCADPATQVALNKAVSDIASGQTGTCLLDCADLCTTNIIPNNGTINGTCSSTAVVATCGVPQLGPLPSQPTSTQVCEAALTTYATYRTCKFTVPGCGASNCFSNCVSNDTVAQFNSQVQDLMIALAGSTDPSCLFSSCQEFCNYSAASATAAGLMSALVVFVAAISAM